MKYLLIVVFFFIALQSCISTKKKKAYLASQRWRLLQAYKATDSVTYFSLPITKFYSKPIKKRKKGEIDKYLKEVEMSIALHPDSTSNKEGLISIDSFYLSPNKIKYIQKRKLKSPNMYFVQ